MDKQLGQLKERLAEIEDLWHMVLLLDWDQYTMMPAGGADARAHQLATLERLSHERATAPELGNLLESLRPYEESLDWQSDDASLIRVARREFERAVRIPVSLRTEYARARSLGRHAWPRARAEADFERLRPFHELTVDLKHRYIECLEPTDDPYDVPLNDWEPGATTAQLRVLFERVKEHLRPLVAAIAEADGEAELATLSGPFPIHRQKAVEGRILRRFGFDDASWRIDPAAHPSMCFPSNGDIRLMSRHYPDRLNGLFHSFHEFGHGVYERGSPDAFQRTPLGRGASFGLHESQSRLWENHVGRSRPFWRCFYDDLQATFPKPLGGVSADGFFRSINRVRPAPIRVEADEVTYGLHLILRVELEQELFTNRLEVKDLPEAWNARMYDYLGVEVESDAEGVLQDLHWAEGMFGYFPSYVVGSVVAAQVFEAARRDLPDLDESIEAGDFGGLHSWLLEHIYRHGGKFTLAETLRRVVGGPIDPEPYLAYLDRKVADVYHTLPRATGSQAPSIRSSRP